MRRWLAGALAGALAACSAPPLPPARLALEAAAPARSRLVVAIAPPRVLQSAARSWKASDVARYDIVLGALNGPDPLPDVGASGTAGASASLPVPPATRTIPLSQAGEAVFDDVPGGWRYQVLVRALGNAGGTAPTLWLNQQRPASATIDLRSAGGSRRLQLTVPLDAQPFGATVRLPSLPDTPERIPDWTTALTASLTEVGAATPVATAAWLPSRRAQFLNVPGDRPYALSVTYFSAAGGRSVTLPNFVIPRQDATDTLQIPNLPVPAPPTGTQMAHASFPGGAFMGAFDPEGRFWLTHQNSHEVSVLNDALDPLLPGLAVGNQPRGIAIDPDTGLVWVANFGSHNVTRLNPDGSPAGTSSMGFLGSPSGIGVDAQHRAWVASHVWGTVRVFNPNGTQMASSPITVGSNPTGLAIDRTTGEVWVANSGDNTVSKLSSEGATLGVYVLGVQPGAIAVAPDHSAWVVSAATNQLIHLAPNGVPIGAPIPVGAGPAGLAIDPRDGSVWVGIQNGALVSKLEASGTILGTWPAGNFPGTLAIDGDSHAWVVGDGQVTRLAP
ncbi:MAG: hypothetical protein VKP62_03300 [Candidatus Sericytochromatia bacterium]|nr:hypothetical protein [Candidatus Sericytochromatia bacterium]